MEVDEDCATSALPRYAADLRALREALAEPLTVTALPTWTGRADEVLAAVDGAVLQVHALDDPAGGLFDAAGAEAAIRAFASTSPGPFRVSLPAYGVRVGPGGVEAEAPLLGGAGGREVRVEPASVAGLIRRLEAEPPPRFAGWLWFRLPVAGDERAWSLPLVRAVIAGEPPSPRLELEREPAPGGATDLWLANPGPVWGSAVEWTVPGRCLAADAVGGWEVELRPDALRFTRAVPLVLDPGRRAALGWARCP